jgi:MFS transporter, OFA family, oxalate/formate antiporter
VIYGVGYILAAYFAGHHSLSGMYIGYGVLSGIGMGMGYITPVATLVKWFPDRRGLMTGVAVAGYGAGALVMSPIAARLVKAHGVPFTFLALGVVYLFLVVIAAQFYANPPQGWRPAGWEPRTAVAKAAGTYDYTAKEAMATWQFWLLWFMLFLNVSAGIMIISQASPMAQEIVHMTPIAAAGMVGLISMFNGARRVFWAWVSDHIGRARVYFLLYLIQAVIFFALPRTHSLTLFSTEFAIIGLCYGGGFGTMPSFTADYFGTKYMGGIYGIILLAWGAAAIPSPIMIARLHQATGVRHSSEHHRVCDGGSAGSAADRAATAAQGHPCARGPRHDRRLNFNQPARRMETSSVFVLGACPWLIACRAPMVSCSTPTRPNC